MVFTPVESSLGALLLHTASFNLLANAGTVFGVSGIVDGAVFGDRARWKWAVMGGMLVVPILIGGLELNGLLAGDRLTSWAMLASHLPRLAVAGGLVGVGSRLGSGCTRLVHRSTKLMVVATFCAAHLACRSAAL